MRTLLFARGIVSLFLFGLPMFGQTFGDITGEVRDTSGAAVQGVQITATNTQTNATRVAVTNEAGVYNFPAIPPGIYTVKAEKTGFKTVTRSNIEIQVQQSARIDIDLPVGQVNESVEVSASAQLLS